MGLSEAMQGISTRSIVHPLSRQNFLHLSRLGNLCDSGVFGQVFQRS